MILRPAPPARQSAAGHERLDDDELGLLAAEVLRKYHGNPATRQPGGHPSPDPTAAAGVPADEVEINALLDGPAGRGSGDAQP